jgi:hypothetical protein
MMRPKRVLYTPVTQAVNNIAQAQTPAGAGALTLNGALCSGGVFTQVRKRSLAYIIGIQSGANLSARTFTVTGTDADGNAQTENLAGPNIGTTVSTKFWLTISSITIDGVAAGALQVGTQNTVLSAVSQSFPQNEYETFASVGVHVTGTISYDLQKAFERMTAGETPTWQAGGLTGQTADGNTGYSTPIGAQRLKVNSYTNGATIAMTMIQSATH